MKGFRDMLRKPRVFLSITVLAFTLNDCPVVVTPPPGPNLACQTNRPVSLQARGCARVEPLCSGVGIWRSGDTLAITGSALDANDSLAFNVLDLYANAIEADGTIMRRVCQNPFFHDSYATGVAQFQYTFQQSIGEGLYNPVTISNHSALTITLTAVGVTTTQVYDRPSDGVAQYNSIAGGGTPPYSFQWFANGVLIPGEIHEGILDIPFRNTEYRVRVTDATQATAFSAVVVFLVHGDGDPTASFTVSPGTLQVNQTATLNPAASTETVSRWEWDFDWQGDVAEPFDATIIGANGTTTTSWSQPGRKYVRLRVITPSGNIDETFQRVMVVVGGRPGS